MIYNRNRKRKKAKKDKGRKKRRTQIQMAAVEGQTSRVLNNILRSSSSPQGETEGVGTAVLVNKDFTTQYQCFFGNEQELNQSEFLLVEGIEPFLKMKSNIYYLVFIVFHIMYYLFRGSESSRNLK